MMINVISLLAYIAFAPLIGGLIAGTDRKITARMQGRKGPSVLQPFYDLFKLFSKETTIVDPLQYFYIIGFYVFTVFTGGLFFFGGDLLLVFFAVTLSEIFFVLCACSANSPFSTMGAQRELFQIMCCEPMILIVAIGYFYATGSFSVSDIIGTKISSIVFMPGVFVGYCYILTIKFRKSPFDLSTSHHAHQEMVKGVTVELSGKTLGILELSHWYENVFLLGVLALFIINASWWSWIAALLVCAAVYFTEILVDNTFARVKWDTLIKSTWIVTLVFGMLNLFILSFIR